VCCKVGTLFDINLSPDDLGWVIPIKALLQVDRLTEKTSSIRDLVHMPPVPPKLGLSHHGKILTLVLVAGEYTYGSLLAWHLSK